MACRSGALQRHFRRAMTTTIQSAWENRLLDKTIVRVEAVLALVASPVRYSLE